MNESAGSLAEVFVSHQGEGPWVGRRQLFLRLAGCSFGCRYCDTPNARSRSLRFWRLRGQNAKQVKSFRNPVLPKDLMPILQLFVRKSGPVHSVAITGGEPLEQPEFLMRLITVLRTTFPRLPILLETNGVLPCSPPAISRQVDFVALDIKIPSSCGRALSLRTVSRHLSAWTKRPGCVKVVVNPRTPPREILAPARLAQRLVPHWDFILQPQSGIHWGKSAAQAHLDRLARTALAVNLQTRIIPQVHFYLGMK